MIGLPPVMFWPGLLIALALLVAFSWVLVRHAGLAITAALSPLPGFAVAMWATGQGPSIFAYLPGFIVAGILVGDVGRLAANMRGRSAVRKSLGDLWLVFLITVLMIVPAIFAGPAALIAIASVFSALIVATPASSFLNYDEDFVVRINRAMEGRLRQIERLDFLIQSRWGMSIGGIALVLSVLGFFGAQKTIALLFSHFVLLGAADVIFAVCAFAVSRNLRRTLASILAMVPTALLMIALTDRFAVPSMDFLLPLAVAAMPVLFITSKAASYERDGDSWETATQRGLEHFAAIIAIVLAAAFAANVLPAFQSPAALAGSASILLGGFAALILQPALTTMLYTLFPKRISLEEAFRKR